VYKRQGQGRQIYEQVVNEGFILTRGQMQNGFGENKYHGLGGKVDLPCLHLLQVHPDHPMGITFSGDNNMPSVRPVGDKRLLGPIVGDKNPLVYDSVLFLLAPYDVTSETKEKDVWEGTVVFNNGFKGVDSVRSPLSLFYSFGGVEIDHRGIRNLSVISPPQIVSHLFDWMYRGDKFSWYDKSKFGQDDSWNYVGRVSIEAREIWDVVRSISGSLERKFGVRLNCSDARS